MNSKIRGELNKGQRGLTFWGFVWGAALFVLLTIALVKTIPHYVNNEKLMHALEELAADPRIMTMHRREMIRNLNRMLNIDYADSIVDLNKAFKVKNIQGKRELSIDYEMVEPLAYNASFLFDFKNHVMAPIK